MRPLNGKTAFVSRYTSKAFHGIDFFWYQIRGTPGIPFLTVIGKNSNQIVQHLPTGQLLVSKVPLKKEETPTKLSTSINIPIA
jgi:hypothetical protein